MAWTSPRTWVTGETVTAAQMNAHVRDNLDALNPLDSVGATSWSPNIEATTANPTGFTSAGRYWRVGPLVVAEALILFDPSGVQNGTGTYFVTLPVAASGLTTSANGFGGQCVGSWHGRDDSSTANSRAGSVQLASTTTIRFNIAAGGSVTESAPFTWGANDVLSFVASYMAA